MESSPCTSPAYWEHTSSLLLAYAAFEESALLERANRPRDCTDPLPAAVATALLRSIRTLGVTGAGPACVAELSFLEVHRVLQSCLDCAPAPGLDADGVLRRWKARHQLAAWSADSVPWTRRLRAAQSRARLASGASALEQCRGLRITGARRREFPLGALEGAPATELIFDDGSAAVIAGEQHPAPGTLLSSSPLRYSDAPTIFTWHFAHPRPPARRLAASADSAVLLQPSPLTRVPEVALL
jgi:hypothetical protein